MDSRDEDILELGGRRVRALNARESEGGACGTPSHDRASKFLSIWFRCCHEYGRLYRNATQTAYEGRCPRCGANVNAQIGPDGSPRRMFEAM